MDRTITHFSRQTSGELELVSEITGLPSLDWVNDLAMHPSGDFLYAAATGANAITVFRRLNGSKDGCGGTCP